MNDAITSDVGDEGLCTSRCEVVNGLLQWCHEDVKVAGVHNVARWSMASFNGVMRTSRLRVFITFPGSVRSVTPMVKALSHSDRFGRMVG